MQMRIKMLKMQKEIQKEKIQSQLKKSFAINAKLLKLAQGSCYAGS